MSLRKHIQSIAFDAGWTPERTLEHVLDYMESTPTIARDTLIAHINEAAGVSVEEEVVPMSAGILCDDTVLINMVEIDDVLFQEEVVEYNLINKEDEIDALYDRIAPAKGAERTFWIQEQDGLRAMPARWVLSSFEKTEYISPSKDPNRFNEICETILEAQAQIADEDK